MNDEGLRKKQMDAAGKFINALSPNNRVSRNLTKGEPALIEFAPSMIAASVVLNS